MNPLGGIATPDNGVKSPGLSSAGKGHRHLGFLLLISLPLVYIWWVLVRQLSIAWSNNTQYAYGWAVPFLCLYLLRERFHNPGCTPVTHASAALKGSPVLYLIFLACLWVPIRLVQEANPGWSLVSWALAGVVIGITLLTVRLVLDSANRHGFELSLFLFPISFFLVAVPWPYVLENPVIQTLTRLNTRLTIEILAGLDIPAVQHGNLIELGTGTVGIDEACSGIRSLQATLMISLFLGELYRLSAVRRVLCVFIGFGISMVCNLARMLLLCWVASQRGIEAIAGWHDPAGVSILLACFLGVWLAACRLKVGNGRHGLPVVQDTPRPITLGDIGAAAASHRLTLGVLVGWLMLVEFSVAGWYHHMESRLPVQPSWSVNWPVAADGYREVPVPKDAADMLRCDEAKQAQWVSGAGRRWQLSWFRWKPGIAAAYLAKSHNPIICMPAAGYETLLVSQPQFADCNGLRLPYRLYAFEHTGRRVYVLYSRWEDRTVEQSFATEGVTRLNRLRSVWTGRGTGGQRVLSLAVWGCPDQWQAETALTEKLRELVVTNELPLTKN